MPGTKSSSGPKLEKTYASIIKDPENQLLTITIPLIFEGSDSGGSDHISTEARPLDTLVDFIQTFINPKKKPESGFWGIDFGSGASVTNFRCTTKEEPSKVKAVPETAPPETESFKLTPAQELRAKCLESARAYAKYHDAYTLTDIAEVFFKWVMNGPLEETQNTPGKA